jgi:hypothetical protein
VNLFRLGSRGLDQDTASHLHTADEDADARVGARALNLGGNIVAVAALPRAFWRLSAAEIEDCLCIYKRELRGDGPRPLKQSWCSLTREAGRC